MLQLPAHSPELSQLMFIFIQLSPAYRLDLRLGFGPRTSDPILSRNSNPAHILSPPMPIWLVPICIVGNLAAGAGGDCPDAADGVEAGVTFQLIGSGIAASQHYTSSGGK